MGSRERHQKLKNWERWKEIKDKTGGEENYGGGDWKERWLLWCVCMCIWTGPILIDLPLYPLNYFFVKNTD